MLSTNVLFYFTIDAPLRQCEFRRAEEKTPNAMSVKGFRVARLEGFEPSPFRIGICCDIQLRHRRFCLYGKIF